jgi:hypothetical protein
LTVDPDGISARLRPRVTLIEKIRACAYAMRSSSFEQNRSVILLIACDSFEARDSNGPTM